MALRPGGTLYFLHTDHLGSTALLTNSSGQKVAGFAVWYFPYGETRPGSGNPPTARRFTGQLEESTIGLYDYGARFYDPALGRFLSADTVVPGAANPQALNRYAYVLNNPLKYTDPTGQLPEPSAWGEPVPYEPDLLSLIYRGTPSSPVVDPSGVDLVGGVAFDAPDVLLGYRMRQGGFRIQPNGQYSSGRGRVSIYGTRASRPDGMDYWTHAGVDNPTILTHTTYSGALKAAFKSWTFWGSIVLSTGVNAVDYSPWGSRGEAGYGTEFAAAVTVDVAVEAGCTAIGAGIMVAFPGPGFVVGPGFAMVAPVIFEVSGGRQWAVGQVANFYDALLTTPNPDPRWGLQDFTYKDFTRQNFAY